MLAGCGPVTQLVPVGFTGPIVTMGSGSMLRDLQFYGGSTTSADNPTAGAISLTAGASQVFIDNIGAFYLNGWVLNPQPIQSVTHLSTESRVGGADTGLSAATIRLLFFSTSRERASGIARSRRPAPSPLGSSDHGECCTIRTLVRVVQHSP